MRDKGFTFIELLASIICLLVLFLIVVASMFGKEPTQDYKLEECMRRYNDFDYCKYKFGVE
jgi:competence protein ComGC